MASTATSSDMASSPNRLVIDSASGMIAAEPPSQESTEKLASGGRYSTATRMGIACAVGDGGMVGWATTDVVSSPGVDGPRPSGCTAHPAALRHSHDPMSNLTMGKPGFERAGGVPALFSLASGGGSRGHKGESVTSESFHD